MPDVPHLESQQAFSPCKSMHLRAVENNLCVSRNVEQVAVFKIDEEQARARMRMMLPSVLKKRLPAKSGKVNA